MEDLVQGLQKGWTPGSLLRAKWRKWRKGSCQGWRASSPQGPTQLSWPACVGLSWQRRRQSLGLPAGAPQTCILPRGSSFWQDQNETGTPSQPTLRETDRTPSWCSQDPGQSPQLLLPPWIPPTAGYPVLTEGPVSCTQVLPALPDSLLPWAPLLGNFPACSTLVSSLHPFIKIHPSHSLSTPSAGR